MRSLVYLSLRLLFIVDYLFQEDCILMQELDLIWEHSLQLFDDVLDLLIVERYLSPSFL